MAPGGRTVGLGTRPRTSARGRASLQVTTEFERNASQLLGDPAHWYDVVCPDTVTYDWATATLKDTTSNTTTTVPPKNRLNPRSALNHNSARWC